MNINQELKKYIETEVLPEYLKNESGHGPKHINYVIEKSFRIVNENNLDVNPDMVYTVAAYHDIGHHIDSAKHEIISAEIMSKDENLKKFFTKDELEIIKEAIEDHRASAKHEPRTIYGKIVSTADRSDSIEKCMARTYTYGQKWLPGATDDELFENAHKSLVKKFGKGGYAKHYFKDSGYDKFLHDIQELLEDKEAFKSKQRDYINKLKKEHKL